MAKQADRLKEEVAEMMTTSTDASHQEKRSDSSSLQERLHLIDALEHLCLDHLFEEEISAALAQIENADVSGYDLGTVALWFFLLRKHRYKVSSGSN